MSVSTPLPVRYRAATERDLDGVVAVFLACWHRSYRHVLPAATIAAMTARRARDLWTPLVRRPPDGAHVATRHDRVVGVTRWSVHPSSRAASIGSLYVDPDIQRAGVGFTLLTQAVDAATAAGCTLITLWVFEPNASARRFYARCGFHPDGTTRVEPEFGVAELRLARRAPSR